MDTLEFLDSVVTTPEGHFVLATNNGEWHEQWFNWPNDRERIIATASTYECDVYFSSYLFSTKSSQKQFVLPTRTIQADLDDADANAIESAPSILVQTSRGRHQGFWILNEALPIEVHEQLSRQITYAIPLCDRSGWPLGRKARLPDTNNCKYVDKQLIKVINDTGRTYDTAELNLSFPLLDRKEATVNEDEDFINNPLREFVDGPHEFIDKLRDKLPPKVVAQYTVRAEDRSEALWALENACFRAGLDRYEVFYLAFHSANNKFAELRLNANRELAKDVLRAEEKGVFDPKLVIAEARHYKLPFDEKQRAIAVTAIDLMKREGSFVRGRDSIGWYVFQGQPIPITHRSGTLSAFLENYLGLNYTEQIQHYVTGALVSHTQSLPPTARIGALTHFNPRANSLYVHTGRKQVLKIVPGNMSHIINGSDGLIFPWQQSFEPFVPLTSGIDWAQALFGDSLEEVVGLNKECALTMLKVWFLFLLFRDLAEARPILAILGEPGSGKSAILRRCYALFYGPEKKLGGITNPNDFDTQTSNFPFVVFDNVDTWEQWLPDRLAQIANNTDIDKRKLYTDNEISSVKRQSMVAVTAHDPKFGRSDVVDRLLMLELRRIPEFRDEKSMVQAILDQRNYLWGSIIDDIMTIMRVPRTIDNSLQFRIQDFATVGLWISKALGVERQFRDAITAIKVQQKSFVLEEENLLVDTLQRAVSRGRLNGTWVTSTEMWAELELVASDSILFQRKYKNTTVLGRRLYALQEPLKAIFNIEFKDEDGRRLWLLSGKLHRS